MKDAIIADTATNPKEIFQVLFPVKAMIVRARCLSNPWWTIATASMSEPIMKKTASLINEEATPSAVSTPKITSIISISIATAGIGIDSEIIKMRAVITIMSVLWASGVNPSGVGR